ncbi:hypothetical protein SNEBB_010515 [Seison nebaliae]|nr:hypothetical protein SNEBB_010515 [Seison nebaliae]
MHQFIQTCLKDIFPSHSMNETSTNAAVTTNDRYRIMTTTTGVNGQIISSPSDLMMNQTDDNSMTSPRAFYAAKRDTKRQFNNQYFVAKCSNENRPSNRSDMAQVLRDYSRRYAKRLIQPNDEINRSPSHYDLYENIGVKKKKNNSMRKVTKSKSSSSSDSNYYLQLNSISLIEESKGDEKLKKMKNFCYTPIDCRNNKGKNLKMNDENEHHQSMHQSLIYENSSNIRFMESGTLYRQQLKKQQEDVLSSKRKNDKRRSYRAAINQLANNDRFSSYDNYSNDFFTDRSLIDDSDSVGMWFLPDQLNRSTHVQSTETLNDISLSGENGKEFNEIMTTANSYCIWRPKQSKNNENIQSNSSTKSCTKNGKSEKFISYDNGDGDDDDSGSSGDGGRKKFVKPNNYLSNNDNLHIDIGGEDKNMMRTDKTISLITSSPIAKSNSMSNRNSSLSIDRQYNFDNNHEHMDGKIYDIESKHIYVKLVDGEASSSSHVSFNSDYDNDQIKNSIRNQKDRSTNLNAKEEQFNHSTMTNDGKDHHLNNNNSNNKKKKNKYFFYRQKSKEANDGRLSNSLTNSNEENLNRKTTPHSTIIQINNNNQKNRKKKIEEIRNENNLWKKSNKHFNKNYQDHLEQRTTNKEKRISFNSSFQQAHSTPQTSNQLEKNINNNYQHLQRHSIILTTTTTTTTNRTSGLLTTDINNFSSSSSSSSVTGFLSPKMILTTTTGTKVSSSLSCSTSSNKSLLNRMRSSISSINHQLSPYHYAMTERQRIKLLINENNFSRQIHNEDDESFHDISLLSSSAATNTITKKNDDYGRLSQTTTTTNNNNNNNGNIDGNENGIIDNNDNSFQIPLSTNLSMSSSISPETIDGNSSDEERTSNDEADDLMSSIELSKFSRNDSMTNSFPSNEQFQNEKMKNRNHLNHQISPFTESDVHRHSSERHQTESFRNTCRTCDELDKFSSSQMLSASIISIRSNDITPNHIMDQSNHFINNHILSQHNNHISNTKIFTDVLTSPNSSSSSASSKLSLRFFPNRRSLQQKMIRSSRQLLKKKTNLIMKPFEMKRTKLNKSHKQDSNHSIPNNPSSLNTSISYDGIWSNDAMKKKRYSDSLYVNTHNTSANAFIPPTYVDKYRPLNGTATEWSNSKKNDNLIVSQKKKLKTPPPIPPPPIIPKQTPTDQSTNNNSFTNSNNMPKKTNFETPKLISKLDFRGSLYSLTSPKSTISSSRKIHWNNDTPHVKLCKTVSVNDNLILDKRKLQQNDVHKRRPSAFLRFFSTQPYDIFHTRHKSATLVDMTNVTSHGKSLKKHNTIIESPTIYEKHPLSNNHSRDLSLTNPTIHDVSDNIFSPIDNNSPKTKISRKFQSRNDYSRKISKSNVAKLAAKFSISSTHLAQRNETKYDTNDNSVRQQQKPLSQYVNGPILCQDDKLKNSQSITNLTDTSPLIENRKVFCSPNQSSLSSYEGMQQKKNDIEKRNSKQNNDKETVLIKKKIKASGGKKIGQIQLIRRNSDEDKLFVDIRNNESNNIDTSITNKKQLTEKNRPRKYTNKNKRNKISSPSTLSKGKQSDSSGITTASALSAATSNSSSRRLSATSSVSLQTSLSANSSIENYCLPDEKRIHESFTFTPFTSQTKKCEKIPIDNIAQLIERRKILNKLRGRLLNNLSNDTIKPNEYFQYLPFLFQMKVDEIFLQTNHDMESDLEKLIIRLKDDLLEASTEEEETTETENKENVDDILQTLKNHKEEHEKRLNSLKEEICSYVDRLKQCEALPNEIGKLSVHGEKLQMILTILLRLIARYSRQLITMKDSEFEKENELEMDETKERIAEVIELKKKFVEESDEVTCVIKRYFNETEFQNYCQMTQTYVELSLSMKDIEMQIESIR